MIIVLDAGHGGRDSGAVSRNGKFMEKDFTLAIVKEMKRLLDKYKVDIVLTRDRDVTMSLKERTDKANGLKADYFLSIHVNAGGGTGYEDYVYNGRISVETVRVRDIIHKEVVKVLPFRNRGKKIKNFHVLRESRMPAILTENLFIDNNDDLEYLKNTGNLKKIAQGHVSGLVKAFNLKLKKEPVKNEGKNFYRVVTGSYLERSNAEKQVQKLRKQGFDSFIDIYKG